MIERSPSNVGPPRIAFDPRRTNASARAINATGKLSSYDIARNLLRECISNSSLIERLARALFEGGLINRDSR